MDSPSGKSVTSTGEVLREDLTHGDINAELGKDGDYTRAVGAFLSRLDNELAQQLGGGN